MRKTALLLFLFLVPYFIIAQKWQTFKSDLEQWYVDANGNLKVVVVDSVHIINQDSVFYFPVTLGFKSRNPIKNKIPANTKTPWWTGSKMVLQPNGNQLFFNAENDTLFFPLNKALNESWTMAKFNSGNYIKATIKTIGVDTIIGSVDSIKAIILEVFSKNNISLSSHLINNQELKISKNHGFVQLIPLFSIVDSPGVWYYERQSQKFKIEKYTLSASGRRLRIKDVYGFEVGDVFQTLKQECGIYIKTKILNKTDFGDSINYRIENTYEHLCNGYKLDSIVQRDWWIHQTDNLFSTYFPDQYVKEYSSFLEYAYQLNACGLITVRKEERNYGFIDDTLYANVSFEAPYISRGYGAHLGMIDSSLTTLEGIFDYHYKLIYAKTKYCNMGTSAYGMNSFNYNVGIMLSPNPTNGILQVKMCTPVSNIKIFNSIGNEMFTTINQVNSYYVIINVSEFTPGLYFIKINDDITLKFVKTN